MFKNYPINQTILPLDMEQYIPETDVVFAVNALVEAPQKTLFNQLEQQLGRPTYHPKIMLKIILYMYAQRVFSGRKIQFLLDDSYRMRLKPMPISSALFGGKRRLGTNAL